MKCEKKSKGTTECSKKTVICDVETTQCEDETVKCKKKITWYSKLPTNRYHTPPLPAPFFLGGYGRITLFCLVLWVGLSICSFFNLSRI